MLLVMAVCQTGRASLVYVNGAEAFLGTSNDDEMLFLMQPTYQRYTHPHIPV